MRRFIAVLLIFSLAVAIAGTYFSSTPQTAAAGNCSVQDATSIQQVISQQTQSLSAQDFPQALTYSSDSFRSRITEGQFARIISIGYEFLLRDPEISFDSCAQESGANTVVLVSFDTGSEVVTLTYSMVNERGGWFIDSASRPGNNQLSA